VPIVVSQAGAHTRLAGACGVFLLTFSVVALSGPGRIDIVDGQARFEVAKSLALHGDLIVRNPAVWFSVFPGRNGQPYSYYRFPHSVLGALAVLVSDGTGPDRDARRHFFFVLVGAVAAATLACLYLAWFLQRGLHLRPAVFWALAGIFCTPAWYYGTSTYDEIFGALAVTAAVVLSISSRSSRLHLPAFWSGLLFGLAFNVKEPLGAFALSGVCAADRREDERLARLARASALVAGLGVGIAAYVAYDLYKFPPGHFFWGVIAFAVSPAAGVLWYCPTLLLCVRGLHHWSRVDRTFSVALSLSVVVFFCFVASVSFFKGDPAWGPRYLTPAFAVLWLFAPDGADRFGMKDAAALLALSAVVQLLALCVDPDRLYVERDLPPGLSAIAPILYFDARNSHLINRPREIVEIWKARHDAGAQFAPAEVPTAAPTVISWLRSGRKGVLEYKMLNSFRPWWISHWYTRADERAISIPDAVAFFCVTLLVGLGLISVSLAQSMPGERMPNIPQR
jgi:hypothetical protein